jgi:hypothetical protein
MSMSDQMVRLVNKSDTDFKDMYNSVTYRVPAGSDGFAPFDAACLWFGDPSSQDLSARDRGRTDEYERLRVRYGVYADEHRFDGALPDIEVYTLDGDRVTMVREDPTGELGQVANPFTATSNADPLAARMNAMQDQMTRLLDAIGTLPADQQAMVVEAARGTTPADAVEATPDDAADGAADGTRAADGAVVKDPKAISSKAKASNQTTLSSGSSGTGSNTPPVDAPTRPQVK